MRTKTIQGKLWSIAPQKWAAHFEPWFLPMYKKALEQLKLSNEHLVLDAGCGSGMFTRLAYDVGANIIGVDAAYGLLEIAQQRNPKVGFLEENLEALPFTNNRFDVVTGFNSFQYANSFENAIAEAKRILKPGGRLVIGIWDKPELSDATQVFNCISTLLPPPTAGAPGRFALSEDGKMESILRETGLKLTYKTQVACPFIFSSRTDAINSFMSTGHAALALNSHCASKVEERIAHALQSFHVTDNFYFLQNHFQVFISEKQ